MDKTMVVEQALVPLRLAAAGAQQERREYGVTFIRAGRVRRRDGELTDWVIPAETLQQAVPLLEGVAVFVDHAPWLEQPSLRNLAGVTFGPVFNRQAGSIDGGLRLYDLPELAWLRALLDQVVADQAAGRETPDIGLSLVFFGRHEWEGPEGSARRVTREISRVESCDLVFGPGAEGRVREVLSAWAASDRAGGDNGGNTAPCLSYPAGSLRPGGPGRRLSVENHSLLKGGQSMSEKQIKMVGAAPADVSQEVAQLRQQVERLSAELARREDDNTVSGMGAAPRSPRIHSMWSAEDELQEAYSQLMGLQPERRVHKLSGIRELYHLLTGDYELRGELGPSRLAYSSGGATADTSTMAELTRNVMNKALVAQMDLMQEYRWWEKVARVENFSSLQQVSWVRYGGVGYSSGTGLPTVAEKAEYQQLYWEDERTTASWTKKGGYLPLSIEMIDRDDVAGWRDVPRQLATAAVVTLSAVASELFTANSGQGAQLDDGDYAFTTDRGNLISQPLDYTNWNTAVDTMYKFSQLMNSSVTESRRMGVRPQFVLVPVDLEAQAISVVTSASKPGTADNDRVPTKRILPEENVITVPDWTSANNWAAVADPNLCPFVGVAFRFGSAPEIFAPAESNHILWLHDVLPIKVRWFFAVSVVDWRGAVKSNV